jgi:hypothetical protein
MTDPKKSSVAPGLIGRAFWLLGWAIFPLSVGLWLSNFKNDDPTRRLLFLVFFGIMCTASLVYIVGWSVSRKWRQPVYRRCFSPYLLGAGGWIVLHLLLAIMHWNQSR